MGISEQAAKEPREGAVIAGKYRLSELLQRGGMGAVWLAKHASLDLPYAIKFIRSGDEATMAKLRGRFEIEAKAVARLHGHPNIVQIIDHGIDGNIPYIVMELLSGETLQARLRRERRLSLTATRQMLEEIVAGLSRAHSLKIVHRDLKPGNIFFAHKDDKTTVKILDFGIAKMLAERQPIYTTTGAIGTTAYMSPEQIRNDRAALDERTDLWALAIILFECLTGERPHSADNDVGIIGSILLREGPSWDASRRVRGLPPALDTFFMRAFAHEKADRFQTAADLLSAFNSAVLPVSEWVPASTRALLTEVLPDHNALHEGEAAFDRALDEATTKPKNGSMQRNTDEMETAVLPERSSAQIPALLATVPDKIVNWLLSGFTARLPRHKLNFYTFIASVLILSTAALFAAMDNEGGAKVDPAQAELEFTVAGGAANPAPSSSALEVANDIGVQAKGSPANPAASSVASSVSTQNLASAAPIQPPPVPMKAAAPVVRPPPSTPLPATSPRPPAKAPTPSSASTLSAAKKKPSWKN